MKIPWNFAKFLIDADGKVKGFWAPIDSPEILEKEIEALLFKSEL